jgi:hypothetical protein
MLMFLRLNLISSKEIASLDLLVPALNLENQIILNVGHLTKMTKVWSSSKAFPKNKVKYFQFCTHKNAIKDKLVPNIYQRLPSMPFQPEAVYSQVKLFRYNKRKKRN